MMTPQPSKSRNFDLCPNHVAILYLWGSTFIVIFLCVGYLLVRSYFFDVELKISIGMMVVAAGAAGGFVSALRRIYSGKRVKAPTGISTQPFQGDD